MLRLHLKKNNNYEPNSKEIFRRFGLWTQCFGLWTCHFVYRCVETLVVSSCPEKSAKIAALSLAPLACASGTASGRIFLALAHFALAALEFFANSGSVSAARKFQ